MRILLLIKFLLVVVLELLREVFALLILFVHLAQVHFELFKETIDGSLVLLLDLVNLLFKALLHFKTFLLEL